MDTSLDRRRLLIFVAFAFGLSWVVALVIYLMGGLSSPMGRLLLVVGYMIMPAIAHVVTRLVTREGWQNLYMRLNLRAGWRQWLVMWLLPGVLTILGVILYFTIYADQADLSLGAFQESYPQVGVAIDAMGPTLFIAVQVIQAFLIAPVVNSLATFGEEFGWRAYLQPKLMPLGARRAVILTGVIWGVWHWPIILMGHNYGLDYPGAPVLGPLLMVVFTVLVGIIFGWATIRGRSVWPAVIGHGALNGMANLGALFQVGSPHTLLGPAPVGLLAMIPWIVVAGWIMLRPNSFVLDEAEVEETSSPKKE